MRIFSIHGPDSGDSRCPNAREDFGCAKKDVEGDAVEFIDEARPLQIRRHDRNGTIGTARPVWHQAILAVLRQAFEVAGVGM
jgi:hypothetical protein